MLIEYTCQDESRTMAASASVALFYWYDRQLPHELPKDLKPFEIHVTQVSMPMPYNADFLPLVIAAIERRWNKSPEIALPQPPRKPPKDFKDIEKRRDKKDEDVVRYEDACMQILEWLKEHGDIRRIAVKDK